MLNFSDYAKKALGALRQDAELRCATVYVSETWTVKATRRHKFDARSRQQEFVVSTGRPNYTERAWIKNAVRAGVRFPVAKVQLTYWPARGKRG